MRASDSHRGGRPVLPITESTLLWSMRAWVAGSRHSIEPERRIARVLARLGARDASEYLFGFMFALLHGAVRPMQVSCPCHPRVGADEQALLSVFALAQEDQSFEALLTLRGFVTPAAAEAAYQAILDAEPDHPVAGLALRQVQLFRRAEEAGPDALQAADAAPDDVAAQTRAADFLLGTGNVDEAFERLLAVVRRTAGSDRDLARKHLVELFGIVGDDDPRVGAARRALTSALF